MTLITGSGLERFMKCRASAVLHRAFDEAGSQWAHRGRETHGYLQRIAEGMPAADSLELVDEEFREACRWIDTDDLRDVLGLTPELALAYCPETDTARVLGVALDREYEKAGVRENEVPMSLDVAGLDSPESPTLGFIADYKEGYSRRTPAQLNWQLRGGALALARAFNLDEVRVQLIHLHENKPAYRDRALFTSADLAMFAFEAKVRWEQALADREMSRVPDCTQGSWCNFCPSYHACPAKVALIKAVVGPEAETIEQRIASMTDDELALAYKLTRAARERLKRIESALHGIGAQRPFMIERRADGVEEWFGTCRVEGNLKIDADRARAIVRELLDEKAVDEVSKYSVTQKLIEEACRKRAGKGQGASKFRTVMDALKKAGAATKPVKHDVDIYPIRPQLAAKAG